MAGFRIDYHMTTSNPAWQADRATARAHPLDPLSPAEIELATSLIRVDARAPAALRFVSVGLREPEKARVLTFRAGEDCEREADAILLDREMGSCIEVVVSLTTHRSPVGE